MILNKFELNDYEEVVDMFYMFMKDVMSNRKLNPKYFYYKEVMEWIRNGNHIVVAKKDGITTGFSMCRVDNLNHLTEDIYVCDYCYVKEEYRKTRTAYLLYHNSYSFAKENNYILSVNGRIDNGVSDMIEKHFNLKPKFKLYEGDING